MGFAANGGDMDDLTTGKRNKRGDWVPNAPLVTSPLFRLPPQLAKLPGWLPGYFLPWNMLFMLSGAVFWTWFFPDVAAMTTWQWGWVLQILVLNLIAVTLFYSALEIPLYLKRRQANRFKYNGKFPGDSPNPAFWFGRQNAEGILRSLGTGVPIWTAFQCLIGWSAANGYGLTLTFAENPIYLLALGFCVPIWHEFHFYCVHRLIHMPFLYKHIHSVHHHSVNPSPWSSLSMHPVEQLLYFSSCLIHFVIPSNPIVALYGLHYSGFGAVVGHIGFDKIELTETRGLDTHAYTHYLHHKYFEVNYGDGLMPLDKLFGSWHDGTAEGDAAMEARFKAKVARVNR
jgi:sterol desaturase/sphingolipid hydroxylase (fatty acid hydroxylase superfamily)